MIANRAKDHLKRQEHEIRLQQHMARYLQQSNTNTTQEQVDYQMSEKLFRTAIRAVAGTEVIGV